MIQLNTSSLFGKQDSSSSLLPSSTETQDSFEKALTASLSANLQLSWFAVELEPPEQEPPSR